MSKGMFQQDMWGQKPSEVCLFVCHAVIHRSVIYDIHPTPYVYGACVSYV